MCITSHPIATADQKGYDLTPYSRISFQAKADREVMVEFYVGGKPQQGKTYFDSFQLPAREIQLDREWKEITLNFGNEDRTSIIHLLCWSVAVDKSAPIEVEMKEILLE